MKKSIHYIITIILISLVSCKTSQKQIEVDTFNHYTINEKGEKKYNVKLFIEEKVKQNEIGENPLLEVDYQITNYSENTLLNTLEKLNIKDIQIIPKQKSVQLFGKRGVDGMVKVLTR
ncbi:hypothetical protein [Flavobacterium filum]|uniref:hypothetical protein n=1 Tax=Flavobacterium TaxID=237 RepID=UPI0023F0F5B6|nr:hypothetical protein [Flavobacterium filum]